MTRPGVGEDEPLEELHRLLLTQQPEVALPGDGLLGEFRRLVGIGQGRAVAVETRRSPGLKQEIDELTADYRRGDAER